jgi:hypothetical protein
MSNIVHIIIMFPMEQGVFLFMRTKVFRMLNIACLCIVSIILINNLKSQLLEPKFIGNLINQERVFLGASLLEGQFHFKCVANSCIYFVQPFATFL